ncbi:ArsR family transcriptional regulator [Natrinema sp. SYSU A 869]|uniref:DUF7344 domain-containing protein n=1 Tax=Natrinema sp. SYSU A 869 TaxID=2871694 RepID=UPI001CA4520E|nr:ArsR family transcriptional regulator [Natrinema sp. SYSU A 869]
MKALRERNPREAIIAPVSDDAGPDAESESVRIEMYHIHLPKLDDAGFVEWDRERDQVRKGPKFETVEELLEQLDGTEQTLHV